MNNSSSNNRDLLTRTSNLLRTALCQLETGNVSETSSSFSEQGPSASTFSASPSGQSLQQGVQRRSASSVSGQGRSASDDFRRAFPGMCSRNVTRPLPSGNLQPPVKKTKGSIKGYVPLRFQPAETWTHDICILGRCNESLTPDRHRLDSLMAAGLGKMKVVFPNKNASHEELQKFMEEKFPKMKGSGGFEVLRAVGGGGGQRVLSLIPPSREGYSVSYLKERLGQAVAYFRPLQIDLDETEVKYDDVGPVINCIKCSTSFTYGEFKNHQLVCNPDGHKNMDLSIEVSDDEVRVPPEVETINADKVPQEIQDAYESPICTSVSDKKEVKDKSDCISHLKDMFPNTSIETLQNSYANKQGNVSEVVDELIRGWDGELEDYFPDFETMMENIDADEPLNLAEHLQKLAPTKITPQRLSVDRGSLFKDSVSFFKKSSFDFDSPVKIVFENEPAIDGGGPRREYFTLLLNCLVSPSNFVRLFEGSEARLLPMHNTDALRASLYKVAGRIIATSILNGGPGFPFLSPAIYSYLISGLSQDIDIVKEDIADIDIRDIVTQIDSLDNFENIPDQILDALVETGFTKKITKENKLEAITSIMLNTVILMRKAELDQFGQGLGPILNEAQKHPDVFKPLFVHVGDVDLTPEMFKSLLMHTHLDDPIKGYFYKYIDNLDAKGLQKLLAFSTGASSIPPMGFHEPDKITLTTIESVLPNSNTCPMDLELPKKVANFEEFSRQMNIALDMQAMGFGII